MSQKIEHLLAVLGLKDCADRIVGCNGADSGSVGGAGGSQAISRQQKGISGGERRRVSVAVQLLTDPSILFCDEPTSGLDSYASYEVMKTLVNLAKTQNKTIVCSIHQPRSEIFDLLAENNGQLVLLSLGDVVYSGPISNAMDWFEGQAEMPPCPKDLNRFDYMIDWSSIDFSSEQQELVSRERRGRLVAAWSVTLTPSSIPGREEHTTSLSGAEKQSSDCPAAPLHEEESEDDESTASHSKRNVAALAWRSLQRPIAHSIVLTKRGMQAQTRNYWWIVAYILVNVVIGLWLGGIFSHPSYTYLGIKSKRGNTMILCIFQPLVYMTVIVYQLSKELRVFDRERKDGWYGPLPFVVSATIKSLPMAIIGTLVYFNIVFFLAEMWRSAEEYAVYLGTLLVFQLAVCTFPFMFACVFRGFTAPATYFFGTYCVLILGAGEYVPVDKIPDHYFWVKYVTVFGEAFKVMLSAFFTDRIFDCPFETSIGVRDATRCRWYNGNDILDMNGHVPLHYYPGPILYVLAYGVIYSVVCWMILTVKVVEPCAPVDSSSVLGALYGVLAAPFISKDPTELARKRRKAELSNRRVGIPSISDQTITSAISAPASPDSIHLDQVSPIDEQQQQQHDSSATKKEATRIHIYEQGLTRCDPIEVRVDQMSLISATHQRVWRLAHRQEGEGEGRSWSWYQLWKTVESTTTILKDLDLSFPPGQLTAIMGSSGAGKTSLLTALLDRTSPNLRMHGSVWYNGSRNPTLRQVNSVCGYVRQDDSHLLPSLTVRETLRYNAELSMDRKLSKSEKWAKVDAIIGLMGLTECADVMIG
ncbi:hypothetical protein DFQ27_000683, partial [Actinomortierella ambigua]